MDVILFINFSAVVFLQTGVILHQTLECDNNYQERQHLSVMVFLSAIGLPDSDIIVLSRRFPRTSSVSEADSLFGVLRGVTSCLTDGWGREGFKSSLLN